MRELRLCIEAGHGGSNRGCYIPGGPDEADYVLDFSSRVKRDCKRLDVPINAMLLRLYDQTLPWEARAKLVRSNDADLVIQLHVNMHPARLLHGVSYFYWPGNARMLGLAAYIDQHMPQELHDAPKPGLKRAQTFVEADDAEWKRDARFLLSRYGCDTLLIELGFAQTDTEALLTINTKERASYAIVAGLREYYMEVYDGTED